MFKSRKFIKSLIWLFLITFFVGMIFFLRKQREATVCKDFALEVHSKNEDPFLTKEMVFNLLKSEGISPGSMKVGEFNLAELEDHIKQLPAVHSVEASFSFLGDLHIKIAEKQAIAQVFPKSGKAYFLCADNTLMPLTLEGSNRIPIVNGYIQTDYSKLFGVIGQDTLLNELEPISNIICLISKVPILKAQIEQIYLKKNREIQLIPKIGDHIIELGLPVNYKQKLENLEVFYSKGINQVGWNKYKTINLKFDNQVVCTKN